MEKNYDIIIIGGGPSGMMAAGRAGELGAKVLLIEKNNRLGKKLSITGGRRCNITNAEFDNRLFLENFPETKHFLFSPFSLFNVEDTFTFFEGRNLPLIVEDRKRAFPKSQKAEDVCKVMIDYVNESGNVEVALNCAFESFALIDKKLTGVNTSKGQFLAKKVILATGGLAAPETGSTGEGINATKKLGHKVTKPDPNLAPLRSSAKWVHDLSGFSLDDVLIRFIQENKTKHKAQGRILFTHFGVSGPLIINSAHKVKNILKKGPVEASIDFYPKLDEGSLDNHFLSLFEESKKKHLKTLLEEELPKRIVKTILSFPKLSFGTTPIHSITKDQRKLLVKTLKNLHFPIEGTMGFAWSIIADGGIDPKEVHFKTMQSRKHDNFYPIGDTLNINRPSGGFSLQLCWTTGFVAGSHAAQSL